MFKRWWVGTFLACLAVTCLAGPTHVGQVDPAQFLQLASDDDVRLEVSLRGALLKAITKIDPQLHQLAGGLESIDVVVLSLREADLDQIRDKIREIEENLQKRGWQRLARVRQEDAEVKVLVLSDEEQIQGLVVMVVELSEGRLIFANIAGEIDLAALSQLGSELNLPGLDAIDVED